MAFAGELKRAGQAIGGYIQHCIRKSGRKFHRLSVDQRGVSAFFIAAGIIPMIGAIGIATDTTRAYLVKSRMISALDAAALAGARDFFAEPGVRNSDVEMFFRSNFPDGFMGTTVVGPDRFGNNIQEIDDQKTLRVSATATLPTTFMRLFLIDSLTLSASSDATRQTGLLDVVLAIDMSTSMTSSLGDGTRLSAARNAAKRLVDIIYDEVEDNRLVRVGIVPWAAKVNVMDRGKENDYDPNHPDNEVVTLASSYDNPFPENFAGDSGPNWYSKTNWKKVGGQWRSPPTFGIQPEDFEYSPQAGMDDLNQIHYVHTSAVPLFTKPAAGWKGCVYARYLRPPNEDDSADILYGIKPTAPNGDVLENWVAWSPMENNTEPRSNSYSDNRGNVCPVSAVVSPTSSNPTECTPCPRVGITRLKSNPEELRNEIDSLQIPGNVELGFSTNIPQGLAWAWRVLMPSEPFTEAAVPIPGVPESVQTVRAIVLLTDGQNQNWQGDSYNRENDSNGTGTVYTHPDVNVNVSWRDARLLDLAKNVKGSGVLIYTIQFIEDSDRLEKLMKAVATGPNKPYYHNAQDAEQLDNIFREIANNLSELRISR